MLEGRTALRLELTWSAGPREAVEPELFALLDALRATGKLTAAAAKTGVPYRQAWGLIAKWSAIIGRPLVVKQQGRGTTLTPLGERLLWLQERIEARLAPHLASAGAEVAHELAALLGAAD